MRLLGLVVGLLSVATMWGAFNAGSFLGVLLGAANWAGTAYLIGAHKEHLGGSEP